MFIITEKTAKKRKGTKTKIHINESIEAEDGRFYASEQVFVAILKHLHELTSKFLKKRKIRVRKKEIQWIVTE